MKFYKLSCLVMAIVSALIFFTTLIYALSGVNIFNDSKEFTGILLAVFGVLTAVCLCISVVGGSITYKVGFYVLHGGIVLLVAGFIIYGLFGEKYDVSVFRGDTFYNSINDTTSEENKLIDLGFSFRFDGVEAEYHLDEDGNPTVAPKMYTAYLTVLYPNTDSPQRVEIAVNRPVHINGYKIYLMSMSNDGQNGATLLFKKDPAEYTVTAGMVMMIIGSFVMCFSSVNDKKRIGGEAK